MLCGGDTLAETHLPYTHLHSPQSPPTPKLIHNHIVIEGVCQELIVRLDAPNEVRSRGANLQNEVLQLLGELTGQ